MEQEQGEQMGDQGNVVLARLDERTKAMQLQMQGLSMTVNTLQATAQSNGNRLTVLETADKGSDEDVDDLKKVISAQREQIDALKEIISGARGALGAWKWIIGFLGVDTIVLLVHLAEDAMIHKP